MHICMSCEQLEIIFIPDSLFKHVFSRNSFHELQTEIVSPSWEESRFVCCPHNKDNKT